MFNEEEWPDIDVEIREDKIDDMFKELQRLRASSPEDIRAAGWVLDAHYDRFPETITPMFKWRFNLVTRDNCRVVEATEPSDAEALNKIREQIGIPVIPVE